ncbi:MAG: DUF4870 domain-containing protein [Cyanobacteria bacterium P01_F01_bin.42]
MTNLDTGLYDEDKRKLLSSLSHAAIFFSPLMLSIGIPITLLFISDDPVVKGNAKESINYHLNMWVYGGIAAFISFFWFTIILLPVIWLTVAFVFVMTWIVPIVAILRCMKGASVYRYPFIVRIF